jgi:hypothetical protein
MQKVCSAVFGIMLMVSAPIWSRAVEPTWNYAVQVSSAVQSSPPQITLSWPQDTSVTPSSYTVYRKAPSATSWGAGTTLAGTATSYTDTGVTAGTAYEYQIVKNAGTYYGYGYIQTGINVPLVESRGKVVLVVDNTYAANLAAELTRLQQDLAGDGWTVLRHDVGRNDSVASVKNLIKADYNADPANVKSVFLFGHVPVPYSGQLNPDGHPDHVGAWPADAYYGDMDGNWTDSSVNYQQTVNTDPVDRARLSNVPGDGKFDQTTIPSTVELQVGRVDLANMPGRTTYGGPATFASEQELLRQYLNKDHNFRHKLLNPQRRGLVGDYFGTRNGEAFAASGFRSFAPLFGANGIANLNTIYNDQKGKWIPELAATDYLFAYGCGAGSYTTIGGLGSTGLYNDGSTVEMVNNDVRAVFTLFFGSWLGDWDHEDNIMRSILATRTYGLACAWSGRPHWFAHPMGLGETIGYAARLTQNNSGLYQNQINSSANLVHVALMGDPTLRLHPVAPPASLGGTSSGGAVTLTWTPSPDSVAGYHVYRGTSANGPFTRLTGSLLTATSYTDASAPAGATYMVRAVKLENTPSGSYYNASQGYFWSAGGSPPPPSDTTPPTISLSAPANNATVSGSSVSVSASASDNVGVVGVQFKLDGANLSSEDLSAPFSVNWDTTSAANGPHTLTAVARDLAGNQTTATTLNVTVSNAASSTVVWVEDVLPAGAGPGSSGGDSWTWVGSSPAPFSGSLAHQSAIASGAHEHYFNWATTTLPVSAGDALFAYVYLDPANPPGEVMLSWNADNWEHRAYWGANNIAYGTDGTASRRYVGPLPTPGQWVRLEVPASQVGLEGQTLVGMSFSTFDGRATWDYAGKSSQSSPPALPTVTVTATDANASEAGADPGVFTITRTGSNTASLTVNYSLSGTAANGADYNTLGTTVTIPAGAASATVTVTPIDDTAVEGSETVVLTLSANAAYTVGSPSSATVTIADNDSAPTLPTVTVAATDANASETGADPGVFTITRTGSNTASLTVNFALSGSAANGTDYISPGSSVTIPAGNSSATVTVTPIDDSLVEGSETVVLTISANAAYTVGSPNNATVTIADNDSAPPPGTNAPTVSVVDYVNLTMPKVGDCTLHVLSPTTLELRMINLKQPDPATVTNWNFVDASGNFTAPALSQFAVTVNGSPVTATAVGFKRRPFYAPLAVRDLRLENNLILQLASAIPDGAAVEVKNPGGALWPSTMLFSITADPLRYSPAIHVNQEGYVPSLPKKATVGYYLGNLGEMDIAPSLGFKLVDTATGAIVYQGTLSNQLDVGWTYSPTPYQKVCVADFSSFTTPGEYRLLVPGLGASLPFLIDDGIAMAFTRTYALGLYHQRCGTDNALPFTRFMHNACHTALVDVPSPQANYSFTWNTIAAYANQTNADNPPQVAPALTSEAAQLYPFVNHGQLDAHGGHHDAGDYSKYTINSALLVHSLMFAVDAFPGVAALDNLGIPESGDGVSDLMQEAKWEADYLARIQDADGGFYFITYPRNREYENNVLPDQGDPQVVWPKTTASTAVGVAALAQCASSPKFKAQYPVEAAAYLQKARLGWQFLTNAIALHGKAGAYQKITHYGDVFTHDDELAWAACEMFLATGDQSIHQTLKSWFPNPNDPATYRWGWWRMWESYGCAVRSYAFAARTGRLPASALDAAYLAKCETEVKGAGQDVYQRAHDSAYGTSFPSQTKAVRGGGWYFSSEQTFDITAAYQLDARPEYLDAIICNMNYEAGVNPANASLITGLGWKRQREIVHQYAQNDWRVLPPDGIPLGSVQSYFSWVDKYGSELSTVCYPANDASAAPYPYYDRWGDIYNVTTEFVAVSTARSLASLAYVAALTPAKSQAWTSATAQIILPAQSGTNQPVTATLQAPGVDLSRARIVWEAAGQEPAYGDEYTFTPATSGAQWVEVEIQLADGRRVFGVTNLFTTNALPTVSITSTDATMTEGGTDTASFTLTRTGSTASDLTVTLAPSGSATKWNDYRRPQGDMPDSFTIPAGQSSVTITVIAVDDTEVEGTETATLTIQADAAYNLGSPGSVTLTIYDNDGAVTLPTVAVAATDANASEAGADPGVFTITRGGSTTAALTVNYTLGGTAGNGTDYSTLSGSVTIPAGAASATVTVTPIDDALVEGSETVVLTLANNASYTVGTPSSATVTIADNDSVPTLPVVTVTATDPNASRVGLDPGTFTFTRTGSTTAALTVNFTLGGAAANGVDYNALGTSVTIPAGAASATLIVTPKASTSLVGSETVMLALTANAAYTIGSPASATVTVAGNSVPVSSIKKVPGNDMQITWASTVGKIYRVAYKSNLTDPAWTDLSANVTATSTTTSWTDTTSGASKQRYYIVYVTN